MLDDHFMLLSGPDYIDSLKGIGKKFLQIEKDKYQADKDLMDYIKILEGQTENLVDGHGELVWMPPGDKYKPASCCEEVGCKLISGLVRGFTQLPRFIPLAPMHIR